eukprot:297892-Prymnesium_polylepis.1
MRRSPVSAMRTTISYSCSTLNVAATSSFPDSCLGWGLEGFRMVPAYSAMKPSGGATPFLAS